MTERPTDPSALLASRAWRFRHSAWLLAVILGFGFASFIGFAYCALRVGTRKWWLRAGATFVATVPGWIIMSAFSSTAEQRADMLRVVPEDYLIILWILLVGYGFIVNRDYLRWRADPKTVRGQDSEDGAPAELTARLAPPPSGAAMPPKAPPTPPPNGPNSGRILDL